MPTAIQHGRKVIIEHDDGRIQTETFNNEHVAGKAVIAVEMRNDDDGPLTYNELVDRWEIYHARPRMKTRTIAVYRRQLQPFLDDYGEVEALPEADHAEDYFDARILTDEMDGLLATMHKVSAIMGVAKKWGYIEKNPVSVSKLLLNALRSRIRI